MKTIVILTLDVTLMGGVERSNNNLAKLFKSKNHDVIIISFFKSSVNPYFDFDDLKIKYLSNRPVGNGLISFLFTFLYLFKFFFLIYNIKSNFLILSCFPRISIFLSLFYFYPKKVIACEHSSFHMHSYIIKVLRLFVYKRLKCVVTLTEHDRIIFSNSGIKSYKIPNFSDFRKTPNFREMNSSKPLVCLSIGRLHHHKGFDRLIDIAIKLKNHNIKFIIVGSGPEESKIKNLIDTNHLSNTISLFPATNNVESYFLDSDIFLMTSITEAAPMVILEAFSFSKPVIAYDCPVGPREIIADNFNGFLVKNGDKSQFIQKLLLIYNSYSLYNKLASNACLYSSQNSANKNYQLWSNLI